MLHPELLSFLLLHAGDYVSLVCLCQCSIRSYFHFYLFNYDVNLVVCRTCVNAPSGAAFISTQYNGSME